MRKSALTRIVELLEQRGYTTHDDNVRLLGISVSTSMNAISKGMRLGMFVADQQQYPKQFRLRRPSDAPMARAGDSKGVDLQNAWLIQKGSP